jgi:hypothetical protein
MRVSAPRTIRASHGFTAKRDRLAPVAPNVGDIVYVAGNKRMRVVSVIPTQLVAEFVDGPACGVTRGRTVRRPG